MKKNLVIENRFCQSLRSSLCRGSTVSGGGLKPDKKMHFKKSYRVEQIKILFKITCFFKLQNVVKFQFFSIKARGGFNNNAYLHYHLHTGCTFHTKENNKVSTSSVNNAVD